jgi:hypothetical protein
MNGEFNGYCSRYYNLTQLLAEQQEQFNTLLDNALPYTGQTNLSELDAIIKCNRKIQRAKARVDDTIVKLNETERTILLIMEYFGIPPHTVLFGEVPEMLLFEIWADDSDTIHIQKIKDLAPPVDEENIIKIKIRHSRNEVMDDDD